MRENHFIFDGELYDQIDGVAMGSPLGPTLANIFMCALEKRYLNDCPTQFKPVLYRRYVDDTFCLFNRRDDVDRFLQHINSFHQNIKFTFEIEENNTLPFLDVLVEGSLTVFPPVFIGRKHLLDFIQILPVSRLTSTKSIWLLCLFTVLFTFVLRTKLFMRKFLKSRQSSAKTAFLKVL